MRRARARGRRRGMAAIELALLLPLLVLLLSVPLYLGRVLWHYTAIERAAQDAARYLSRVPLSEMSNPARAPAAVAVANALVAEELAELRPGGYPYLLLVSCDGVTCGGYSTPATVTVGIQLYMDDTGFPASTGGTLPLAAYVSLAYLGR